MHDTKGIKWKTRKAGKRVWLVAAPSGGARNWLVGIPTGQKKISKHTKTGANAYNFFTAQKTTNKCIYMTYGYIFSMTINSVGLV
jgi:hypothetical protein